MKITAKNTEIFQNVVNLGNVALFVACGVYFYQINEYYFEKYVHNGKGDCTCPETSVTPNCILPGRLTCKNKNENEHTGISVNILLNRAGYIVGYAGMTLMAWLLITVLIKFFFKQHPAKYYKDYIDQGKYLSSNCFIEKYTVLRYLYFLVGIVTPNNESFKNECSSYVLTKVSDSSSSSNTTKVNNKLAFLLPPISFLVIGGMCIGYGYLTSGKKKDDDNDDAAEA